jgi:hypothetical protein
MASQSTPASFLKAVSKRLPLTSGFACSSQEELPTIHSGSHRAYLVLVHVLSRCFRYGLDSFSVARCEAGAQLFFTFVAFAISVSFIAPALRISFEIFVDPENRIAMFAAGSMTSRMARLSSVVSNVGDSGRTFPIE